MDAELSLAMSAASALGTHALAVFFGALVVVLLAAGALWWLLHRHAIPRQTSRLPAAAFLLLWLAIGFAVIVGGAALFAELAAALHADEKMGRFDEALSSAIRQHISRSTLQVFAWLTRFGDTLTIIALGIVVAVLLLANRRRWLALGWIVAVAGNGAALNPLLKRIFERVRPLHDHGLAFEEGWSFPSGHSSSSVVAYGMLAYVLVRVLPAVWHLPVVLLASALAFSTGASRVFLQVHYVSDVVAGFATGSAWLAACIGSIELTRYYRRRRY